jgi:hypothetical protein
MLSLSHLWQRQGKHAEAHQLLAEIYTADSPRGLTLLTSRRLRRCWRNWLERQCGDKESCMALDARKRQQKLAKKMAKRKAVVATKKSLGEVGGYVSHGRQTMPTASAPIHECLVPDSLFDIGIGNVIVSRRMPNGFIGAAVFLVDVFCLGIKDVFYDVLSPVEYDYRVSGLQQETFRAIHPTCARKLVEGAEAYARDLGFNPHPDYQRARQIFGDLDATACPTRYVFGRDGKPFFMSGPYDTPARSRRIIDTLTRSCGPEGFHFTVARGAPLELW